LRYISSSAMRFALHVQTHTHRKNQTASRISIEDSRKPA
jgi:hypothetical protein